MGNKTIPVSEKTHRRAKDMKREGETWDEFVCRALETMNGGVDGAYSGVEDEREVDVPNDEDIEEAAKRAIDAKLPDIRDVTADEVIDRIEARH